MATQLLIHTPRWVYCLFIALVALGLRQTRSRNVNAVLAYVLPFVMIVLSLASIKSSFGIQPVPIAMWALGLVSVTAIGLKHLRDAGVRFNPANRSFFIPGSWTPFFVIMAIFFTKYAFGVLHALHAEMVTNGIFVAALSAAYGCFSGYLLSRTLNLIAVSKDTQTVTSRSTQ